MFDKKILCLGNNDESTDHMVSELAQRDCTINHGLVVNDDFVPVVPGYYHTTVVDIPYGQIIQLSKEFDVVVFLDQPQSAWSNWKPFLSTYKIMVELDNQGKQVVYQQNNNVQKIKEFETFVKTNQSFCIYPWINYTEENGQGSLCVRTSQRFSHSIPIENWQHNKVLQPFRDKMLVGQRVEDFCTKCYDYEAKGIESYRQFETKEWVAKLGLTSIDDIEKIDQPYYYELRLSNKCNLMCRGCIPQHSHLIEQEFRQHNIVSDKLLTPAKYSSIDVINIEQLNPLVRVYLTGGDPTVIPEVYTFMQRCIKANRTDFEFTLGINAQKISDKFLELTDHFSNLNFSISLDGYGLINDYWRWGSDFDTVIKNTKLLASRGHNISINTVPGIYNVTNLHLLYEFLDQEFPHTSVYSQINYLPFQSPYNHPNVDLCLTSLEKVKKTNMYFSDGKSNKTAIDSLYNHYINRPQCDWAALQEFFNYNDKLDQVRGSKLGDYIPELEACRELLYLNSRLAQR